MRQALQYAAGIVHFGRDPGLAGCLASLRDQTQQPQAVVVVDHDSPTEASAERDALKRAFPEVEWLHAPNGGYAAGANRVVELALRRAPGVDYVLILNPDVELEPAFSLETIDAMASRPAVALASGKLLRPGGRLIDSAGIVMGRSRRFRDRGSEELDEGRYGAIETVFAVSGAALMLRRSALADLALAGELFDEDFFTYHEDTDLAWRARQLGWLCLYVPTARANTCAAGAGTAAGGWPIRFADTRGRTATLSCSKTTVRWPSSAICLSSCRSSLPGWDSPCSSTGRCSGHTSRQPGMRGARWRSGRSCGAI